MEQTGEIELGDKQRIALQAQKDHTYSQFQPMNYRYLLREMETMKEENKRRTSQALRQRIYRQKLKQLETVDEAKKRRAIEAERVRTYLQKRRQQESDEEANRRRELQAHRQFVYRQRQKQRQTDKEAQASRDKKNEWKRAYRQRQREQETEEGANMRRTKHAERIRAYRQKRKEREMDQEDKRLSSTQTIDDQRCTQTLYEKSRLRSDLKRKVIEVGFTAATGGPSKGTRQMDVAKDDLFGETFSDSEDEGSNLKIMKLNEESRASADESTHPDATSLQIKYELPSPPGLSPSPFTIFVSPASNFKIKQEYKYVEQPLTKAQVQTRMRVLEEEIAAFKECRKEQRAIYNNDRVLLSERFFAHQIQSNQERIIYDKEQEYEDLENILHQYE